MFKIIEGDFKNNKYSNEEYLDNWPMLYILENGKKAYIGESNHVKTRMTQHTTNEEKRIFNKVHFIYSRLFNQSVTFDYESKLIQYIVADELFQVTNKNSGIADKQYYEKGKYDKKFELLWRKLQQEKLVKHSLEEIENSDLFKYSPYKELNDSQRKAVEDILAQIESGNVNRVVVNGMPGSGSDKRTKNSRINDTKKRIREEFQSNNMFCWITKGKEIENYIPWEAINKKYPRIDKQCGEYELFPEYIKTVYPGFVQSKVKFAKEICPYITKENSSELLDLQKNIKLLIEQIKKWNKI